MLVYARHSVLELIKLAFPMRSAFFWDGTDKLPRNVGNQIPICAAPKTGSAQVSFTLTWKPEIRPAFPFVKKFLDFISINQKPASFSKADFYGIS